MSASATVRFPRLLDAERYVPALWDLRRDAAARAHWTRMFALQLEDMSALVARRRGAGAAAAARAAAREVVDRLAGLDRDGLEAWPHVHAWTVLRDSTLARHGVDDPYRELRDRENRRALAELDEAAREVLAEPDPDRALATALAGVLAGNRFDQGSPLAARAQAGRRRPFRELRAEAAARRWRRDDRAALARRLAGAPSDRRVLVLADNAGADFVCGVLPLAAHLARRGLATTLAVNSRPTLNDVWFDEAVTLLAAAGQRVAALAAATAGGTIRLVATGTSCPGIDLGAVSPELAAEADRAWLLVLVGQGRAIETNWRAHFDLPVLRLAAIKDELVAAALGAVPGDLVAEVRPAAAPGSLRLATRPGRAARADRRWPGAGAGPASRRTPGAS